MDRHWVAAIDNLHPSVRDKGARFVAAALFYTFLIEDDDLNARRPGMSRKYRRHIAGRLERLAVMLRRGELATPEVAQRAFPEIDAVIADINQLNDEYDVQDTDLYEARCIYLRAWYRDTFEEIYLTGRPLTAIERELSDTTQNLIQHYETLFDYHVWELADRTHRPRNRIDIMDAADPREIQVDELNYHRLSADPFSQTYAGFEPCHNMACSKYTGDDVCGVCLEDMASNEDTCTRLPCGHVFHRACVDMWLGDVPSGLNNTCPLCAQPAGCRVDRSDPPAGWLTGVIGAIGDWLDVYDQ